MPQQNLDLGAGEILGVFRPINFAFCTVYVTFLTQKIVIKLSILLVNQRVFVIVNWQSSDEYTLHNSNYTAVGLSSNIMLQRS